MGRARFENTKNPVWTYPKYMREVAKGRPCPAEWRVRYLAVYVRDKDADKFEKTIDQRLYKIKRRTREHPRETRRLYVIVSPSEERDNRLRELINTNRIGKIIN